jgi:hypothetical protein
MLLQQTTAAPWTTGALSVLVWIVCAHSYDATSLLCGMEFVSHSGFYGLRMKYWNTKQVPKFFKM